PQLVKYSVGGNALIEGEVLSSKNGGELRIDLSEVPNGKYKLYAEIAKWGEGGEISIWQRQKQLTDLISFYSENDVDENDVFLTDLELDDFRKTITLKFREGIDGWKIRVKRWILKLD